MNKTPKSLRKAVKRKPPPKHAASVADEAWFQDAAVRAVFAALNREGHEVRIVGGALRNTFLRTPVKDIDFAATAAPKQVMAMARKAGLRAVPTGIEHGTVTVIAGGKPFEVTTLREDIKTDGRRAEVRFTDDWLADASRRDFTMNALYAGEDGTVYDPLGGIGDILARRVRFIGNPDQRIAEDYLRILRFFRFNAEYGAGEFDQGGMCASIRGRRGLSRLSAERIRVEFLRILTAPGAAAACRALAESGLLTQITGSVARLGCFDRLVSIESTHGLDADAIRRLAALCVFVEEDALRLALRLRLSNAERGRLRNCAARWMIRPDDQKPAKALLYALGPADYRDDVLMAWMRSYAGADDKAWARLYALPERWAPPPFPLSGADLIALGARKGPAIGKLLRHLENLWINSGFAKTREGLLAAARRLIRQGDGEPLSR